MTATSHYKSNLRDLFFNLFEFYDIGRTTLGKGTFTSLDEAAARDTLTQLEKLCAGELAASFSSTDRVGVELSEDGRVVLPEPLKRSLRAYLDNDWHLLEMPEELGGLGAPPSLAWAGLELLTGSHPTAAFYLMTLFMLRVIHRLATPEQSRRFFPHAVERIWNCTMVLTEPDAGSDVGAGRTRARHVDGDEWHIEGVKRFITGGDADVFENILHLVLARPEGAGPGTKGLSLFVVPRIWVNPDGSLGERNGVRVTKVEHKLGLRGSATCELTFGDEGPCRGLLLGGTHSGIAQMFQIIEQARMAIGLKSMSTLSTAYLNALAYTKERVQGPDLMRAADKTAPRVTILHHPDVRRMLMMQKAHAEGMRALCFFAASIQDEVALAGGHGAKDAAELDHLNDLLLPLVKGYCSEKTYELLALSLQCFGGSGYLDDYPIEQYIRDQKIDSLYEGTTHIQALDLLLRKIARDGGATLRGLLGRVQETLAKQEGGDKLAPERARLAEALAQTNGLLMALLGKMQESLYHVGLHGNRVLFVLAEVIIAWLLIRQAALAQARLDALPAETGEAIEGDRAFFLGKVQSARFFCAEVLPRIAVEKTRIEASELSLMNLPEAAF